MFTKKIIAAAISLSMAAVMAGCASTESGSTAETANAAAETEAAKTAEGKKLNIVCTIFPEYDWVREILGDNADNAEITYLLDNGADLHSYQPTAEDMLKIANCDLFIYVGGESDEWAEEALKGAANSDRKAISLMEVLGDKAKAEELKEGMQGEEEEEEEHEEGHDHDEGEVEYDEHVWLSLKNAKLLCAEIADEISDIDPEHADTYKKNLDAYTEKLDTLDNDLETLIKGAGDTTLIFADRFPFRYFTDDYGIDYYAAFIGCSAETEASFETITFLANKVDELGTDTIYTIENSDSKIAKAVQDASESKPQNTAVLNSVQSVSKEDIENGVTYLSIMQQNYDVLKADIG